MIHCGLRNNKQDKQDGEKIGEAMKGKKANLEGNSFKRRKLKLNDSEETNWNKSRLATTSK